MLLSDIIAHGKQNYPDHVALIFRDQPITYAQLAAEVEQQAARLTMLGIRPGERIGLLLPNGPPFVYGYYAAAQIGAAVVPANPLLKPPELEYIWRDADVRLVLTAEPFFANAQAAQQNLPALRHIVRIEEREQSPASLPSLVPPAQPLHERPTPNAQRLTPNACAVILYTSGTTGHPKGAMLSHKNLTVNVAQVQAALRFDTRDRFLTVLPLFHSFAGTVCMNTALAAGCGSVLMESFAPARALEAIEKHRVTIFCGVPALFHALLHFPPDRDYDQSSLRLFVSGGAPLPAATLTALEQRFGVPVIEGDGPTECSPVTSVNPLEGPRKPGSVGLPLPGVQIAIFDDQDRPLPTDAVGEIVVRGENVMLGYLNQPEATAEAMRSGWYHTGDLGKMDADGYVYIVDRKKDMIITAGLNVYPREVEEVLRAHPAVEEVAVIGLPDALRGEEVTAVVVRKPEPAVTERELIAFCRQRLANYKAPRRVSFRDSLPRGATGKVLKRLLLKELENEIPDPTAG